MAATYSRELERDAREKRDRACPSMESFASSFRRNPERSVPWLTCDMYIKRQRYNRKKEQTKTKRQRQESSVVNRDKNDLVKSSETSNSPTKRKGESCILISID